MPDPHQPGTQQKTEAAAAIAALLVGDLGSTVAHAVPTVASALLPILPAYLLATPALAASVAEEAAKIALTDPPRFDVEVGEFERRARLENLLKRGFFAVAAARRLAGAVRGPSDAPAPERLAKALRAERSYLTAHNNARARNLDGARKTDEAREMFGDIVSWNHGARGTPVEPRPAHVAADGKLWDLRKGVPVSTGGLPFTKPGCSCAWGPPRAGAETLV